MSGFILTITNQHDFKSPIFTQCASRRTYRFDDHFPYNLCQSIGRPFTHVLLRLLHIYKLIPGERIRGHRSSQVLANSSLLDYTN